MDRFVGLKKAIMVSIIGLLLFLIGYSIFLVMSPHIELKGNDKIEVVVGTKYLEKGYSATYGNSNLNNLVKVKGEVDANKIGEYKIEYKVNYNGITKKIFRTVVVKDSERPTITLKGSSDTTVCPNTTYQEEGYQAIDNYDGDITTKVKVTNEKDQVIYTVQDAAKNDSIKIRNLKTDTEKPIITLNGFKNVTIGVNQNYVEAGYEVADNCDKNIHSKVKTIGFVNNKKEGIYHITYQAVDEAGNKNEVTRVVRVVNSKEKGLGKVIYLTFDDGPSRSITPKLLDVLKEENVKATFFVINHAKELDYLIKREYEEGHTVALHSYSHNYKKIYSSKEAYFDDLYNIQNKVYQIIGYKPTIIRFPGGVSNTVSRRYSKGLMTTLAKEVENQGFRYFDWNITSKDAEGGKASATKIYNNVVKNLNYSSNIVLMHDFENNNGVIEGVKKIIQYGKSHGYTFASITESTPDYHHKINN